MKSLALILALCAAMLPSAANAATAYFTGNMQQTQTVTYQMAWRCEYRYAGQTFWLVFAGTCPANVEVQ